MDELLDLMVSTLAVIVVQGGTRGAREALGLFTRSDLNRHPFRAEIYFLIAQLETELAKTVRRIFSTPWEWLDRLSEEKQARILGYWEVSKRRGVDIGPVGATTLSELLNIASGSETLRSTLGYKSRNAFSENVRRIPELRNQIMHPVRPLIIGEDSILKLKTDVKTVLVMSERLRKANRALRAIRFSK